MCHRLVGAYRQVRIGEIRQSLPLTQKSPLFHHLFAGFTTIHDELPQCTCRKNQHNSSNMNSPPPRREIKVGVSGNVRRAILRLIGRWLAGEIRDARTRWIYGFEQGRFWLAVPITAATMYVLWHWAFGLSFYFGVSFVAAASLAILRGHVFTHPLRLVFVAVAVVIGSFVIPSLAGDAWAAFRRGDTVTALALVGMVVLTWLLKRYLETGRIKGRNVPSRRRRGKSRSRARRR